MEKTCKTNSVEPLVTCVMIDFFPLNINYYSTCLSSFPPSGHTSIEYNTFLCPQHHSYLLQGSHLTHRAASYMTIAPRTRILVGWVSHGGRWEIFAYMMHVSPSFLLCLSPPLSPLFLYPAICS